MKQPTFVYGRDWLDRPIIVDAGPPIADLHPLDDMHSSAQRAIILAPLTRGERELLRMSRGLDLNGRRVVVCWILVQRRAKYERDREVELSRATHLRQMDIVEDERRRAERWCQWQARLAAKERELPQHPTVVVSTGSTIVPGPPPPERPRRQRDRGRDR